MKKNLLWSLFAVAAILTACNDDSAIIPENVPAPTGPEVPVSFAVNIGNPISTYATQSDKGAWTNYGNDAQMKTEYVRRGVLQVFQGDKTEFLTESRIVENPDEPWNGTQVDFTNLRLQAGATYTAVVWLDFVGHDATDPSSASDLFYDTKNLSNVSMKSGSPLDLSKLDPEGRDAYTAHITFTVNPNGTYGILGGDQDQKIATAIPMTAKRPFGKVRLVMTDHDNKAEWEKYFSQTSNSRILNYVAMTVNSLNTGYNALTGAVIDQKAGKNDGGDGDSFQFHHSYASAISGGGGSAYTLNNIAWVDENGKSATGEESSKYPVLDVNYFLPAPTGPASYTMGIKMFNMPAEITGVLTAALAATEVTADQQNAGVKNGEQTWKCISLRNITVPVKANCLTTVMGNFLTYGYSFQVTVTDEFGSEDVSTVDDKGESTARVETIPFSEACKATITKSTEDGKVTAIQIDGMDAVSQPAVLALLKNEDYHGDVDLTINATALADNAFNLTDNNGLKFKSVTFNTPANADALAALTLDFAGSDVVTINATTNTNQYQSLTINNAPAVILATGQYENLTSTGGDSGSKFNISDGVQFKAGTSNASDGAVISIAAKTVTIGEATNSTAAIMPAYSTFIASNATGWQQICVPGQPACAPALKYTAYSPSGHVSTTDDTAWKNATWTQVESSKGE